MKKVFYVLTVIFLLSGCYWKKTGCMRWTLVPGSPDDVLEVHSREDMLTAIDALDCSKDNSDTESGGTVSGTITTTDALDLCNLKNKYTVIDEELFQEKVYIEETNMEEERETRKLTLKMNEYDFDFSVSSVNRCTSSFSADCFARSYVIVTDYQEKATDYFETQFNEINKNSVCDMNLSTPYNSNKVCSVTKESEIDIAIQYIYDYVDYLNDLEIRILNNRYFIEIEFPTKQTVTGANEGMLFKISLENGKYVLKYDNEITLDIKSDIKSYIAEKEIFE